MNKRIAMPTMIVIGLGIAASAVASTIRYDYDREVDFSNWQHVAWRSPERAGLSMVEKRIAKAIEDGFEGRGYTLVVEHERADFLISYRRPRRRSQGC